MPYMNQSFHLPVMVKEVVGFIDPSNEQTIVDCTLGGGGYVEAIKELAPDAKILGVDQDLDAIEFAKKRLSRFGNIEYFNLNFSQLEQVTKIPVDRFIFDLGI